MQQEEWMSQNEWKQSQAEAEQMTFAEQKQVGNEAVQVIADQVTAERQNKGFAAAADRQNKDFAKKQIQEQKKLKVKQRYQEILKQEKNGLQKTVKQTAGLEKHAKRNQSKQERLQNEAEMMTERERIIHQRQHVQKYTLFQFQGQDIYIL